LTKQKQDPTLFLLFIISIFIDMTRFFALKLSYSIVNSAIEKRLPAIPY